MRERLLSAVLMVAGCAFVACDSGEEPSVAGASEACSKLTPKQCGAEEACARASARAYDFEQRCWISTAETICAPRNARCGRVRTVSETGATACWELVGDCPGGHAGAMDETCSRLVGEDVQCGPGCAELGRNQMCCSSAGAYHPWCDNGEWRCERDDQMTDECYDAEPLPVSPDVPESDDAAHEGA